MKDEIIETVVYEYDAREWSRGEAWRHLWEAYLASAQYQAKRNPMRKAHFDSYADFSRPVAWRWTGPLLTPRLDRDLRKRCESEGLDRRRRLIA